MMTRRHPTAQELREIKYGYQFAVLFGQREAIAGALFGTKVSPPDPRVEILPPRVRVLLVRGLHPKLTVGAARDLYPRIAALLDAEIDRALEREYVIRKANDAPRLRGQSPIASVLGRLASLNDYERLHDVGPGNTDFSLTPRRAAGTPRPSFGRARTPSQAKRAQTIEDGV